MPELVCSSIFSVFLSDTLLSGNIIAGLVSEAACGKPLASVAGEISSVDGDGCSGVDVGSGCSVGRGVADGFSCGSLRDSLGLDSGADDCTGGSEFEIDGDEVVLNDGIGSSVSLDAGFGSGFVIEIGTAADTGVVLVVGGSVGIGAPAGVDDRVASTETDGLFISGVDDGDGDIAAEVGDGDGDVESDEASDADTGVDIVGDGVSGLMVSGGIGVDGAAAGEDGVDETEVTDVAGEEGMRVDDDGCVGTDIGSGCSVGRGVVGTAALGVVDNDTVGDAAG